MIDLEIERLKTILDKKESKDKILAILDLIDETVVRDCIDVGFEMAYADKCSPFDEVLKKHAITGAIVAVMQSPEFKILKDYLKKE